MVDLSRPARQSYLLLSVMVVACSAAGPDADGGESTGSSASGEPASSSAGSTSSATSTTTSSTQDSTGPQSSTTEADASTGPAETASESTGELPGTSTGDDTTASACDPQPEDIQTVIVLDPSQGSETRGPASILSCVVGAITTPAVHTKEIALDCGLEQHTISISATPSIDLPITAGQSLEFHRFVFAPWWTNVYFTLRDQQGELLVAAVDAAHLPGVVPEDDPPSDMFLPLEMTAVSVCEEECAPSGDGGNFVIDTCPCYTRHAVDIAIGDQVERVYDAGTATLAGAPSWNVRVQEARTWDASCSTDNPGGWTTVLVWRDAAN